MGDVIMRRKQIHNLPQRRRRNGFTLIELLVVIAIIAALVALSASAVIKFLGSQQQTNTQSTLDRTQGKLNVAWSKVKDTAFRETIPPAVDAWIRTNLAGNDANATGRVRVIYVKLRQRQVFPMSFNEALTPPTLPGPPANPCPLPPLPSYVTYLSKLGITGSLGLPASDDFESSACLLMALQRGQSGAGFDPSELTAGGSTGSYSASGGSLPYLTDAWGKPLHFSRVPVGNPTLNPKGAQAGNNDPNDPQGFLGTGTWGTTYGPSFTLVTGQKLAPGNTSYRIAPLLCSSGIDKALQITDLYTFTPGVGSDDQFSTPQ
jgi:prepilin-type N-terminal cleavage/methylation domain-containing protein